MYKIDLEVNRLKNEEKRLKRNLDKIEENIQFIRLINKCVNDKEVNCKLETIIGYKNELIQEHNNLLFLINAIENIMEEVG